MKSVSIVIPNYNGLSLLKENLKYIILLKSKHSEVKEIIIVDDASTDTSVDYLEKYYPQVRIVKKAINSGFSESVNLGVKNASSDLVLLLNTDVKAEKDLIEKLLPYFEERDVFAVGCLEKSIEGKEIIDRGRGIGVFENGFLVHKKGDINSKNTLWVSGGSSMFSKNIWESIGGLDLLFGPFYWEDIDISYRALKCGYKIYFAKEAVIYHKHEAGAIRTYYTKDYVNKIAFRNQIMFVWKNISDRGFLFQHIRYAVYNFIIFLLTGRLSLVGSYFDALGKLPRILKERRKLKMKWKKKDKDILNQFISEYTNLN